MTGVLSSDILEEQFGPTELKVLRQDADSRIICTLGAGGNEVLEISRVAFGPGVREFAETHGKVLDGQSMGKAFRDDGIEFKRDVKASYQLALPASFGQWFGSREPATVVVVSITVGSGKTAYAEILEIYSPAVVWPVSDDKPEASQLSIIKQVGEFLAGQAVIR